MSSCSFSRKKFHGRRPAVVDVGCSCRPKLKFFFTSLFSSSSSSDSSSKHSNTNSTAASNSSSATYSWNPMTTTTSHYEETTTPSPPLLAQSDVEAMRTRRRRRRRKKKAMAADGAEGRAARESVAVVKETTEPYVAFKESMVQMIVEKEMYGWDDLNDLLGRFLALNSPCHHRLIFRAFADLWDGTTVATSSAAAGEDHDHAPFTGAASPSPYNSYYYY